MNQLIIFNNETTERQMYATLDSSVKENKAKLFNATENADVLAMDCVGQSLVLKDVYLEKIPKINEETGEPTDETAFSIDNYGRLRKIEINNIDFNDVSSKDIVNNTV